MLAGGMTLAILTAAAASPAPGAPCLRALRPLPAGEAPTAADFAPAACGPRPPRPAFVLDTRSRTARSARDLAEGEIVPALPSFAFAAVRPGQAVWIETRVGPVVVQRQVQAVQAARAGQRVFVKDAAGAVFAAELPGLSP